MCPYPIYLKKRDVYVPCGKCGSCLRRQISDYSSRLQHELRKSDCGYFVTLTYAENPFELVKSDLQDYFKRLRRRGYKFSYFALGDYGDTFGRPHYHVLFFVKGYFSPDGLYDRWVAGDSGECRGFIQIQPISVGRISYVVRYGFLAKLDWSRLDERVKPFFLMSRNPAIGASYVTEAKRRFHRSNDFWFYPDGRFKKALPRYWKNKIFSGKIESLLHQEVFERSSQVKKQVDLVEFSKTNPLNTEEKWIERLKRNADVYLNGLRKQKQLKNKLL